MDRIKKNFGFGFMRLPKQGDLIDTNELNKMVDAFIENGFNYFDTAHGYHEGKSEIALRQCLTSRYPRGSYVLTNKLTGSFFKCREDIRPLLEKQLEACGVDYFDFYLMHSQTATSYEHFKRNSAYEEALKLKAEGKFRHFGISFHDTAEVLEKILTEYPEIEVVQIQLNYIDYNDPAVQSGKVYDVCKRFNKKVIVMEPVKGGHLVNLPQEAKTVFDDLHGGSYASYAIRYAAGFENVFMVLSGMSNLEQMTDNIGYMKDFKPLNCEEKEAVEKVCRVFDSLNLVKCTSCRYCTDGCPKNIPIPDVFSLLNMRNLYDSWNPIFYYSIRTKNKGKASDCIKCGKCENVCPQHLHIRELLEKAAKTFE